MIYYLGVDIGTTSTKAVAFSEKGEVLATVPVAYGMQHPQPGWSEQDPVEIFRAVVKSIQDLVKALAPHPPLFVSFSAAMHSLLAVDENGNVLTPSLIWADNRAAQVAEELKAGDRGYTFYQATGVPIHAMSPLCKLLWLKQYQSELFHAAFKFIGIKEYVFYQLFGRYVVDTSVASATGLLNSRTQQWDATILDFIGIDTPQLSEVVSSKQVFYLKEGNSSLLSDPAIPFVIGASDGALSNLGTGTVGHHAMAITIGTSGAARVMLTAPETDSQMRTFCYHLKDSYYIVGGANNNGAVVLQWLKERLLQTNETYEELFAKAAGIAAGSEGLLFLPYILGERAPLWNSAARGVYFGLSIQHTKAHLVKASIEGMMYSLYSIGKIITEKNPVTEIHASGGFAQNRLGLQVLADVFNIKVLVSGAVESSALGAVMLGAEALDIRTNFSNKVLAVYHPNADRHEVYKQGFAQFERVYELVKGEMGL